MSIIRQLLASLSSQQVLQRKVVPQAAAGVLERGRLLQRPSWSKLCALRGNKSFSTDIASDHLSKEQVRKDGGLLLSDSCVQVNVQY